MNNNRLISFILLGLIVCCLLLGTSFTAQAQPPEPEFKFSSSLNPVGSGARALAMGGAFIALADDATAASWNPAGLKHLLQPEMSIVGNYDQRSEDFSFSRSPGASNRYHLSDEHLNYLSLAYPFRWKNRNFVVSLNYQKLYTLNRKMHFSYPYTYTDPNVYINMNYKVSYRQKGDLKATSPALAVFLTNRLFLGVTLNFWSDALSKASPDTFSANGWVEDYSRTGQGKVNGMAFESYANKIDRYSFSGFNINLGLLWDVNRFLSLGAVVKTPFTASIRHKGKKLVNQNLPAYESWNSQEELRMPLSYGLGLAIRPTDRLTFDLDIYRIEWNEYVWRDASGQKINPITCLPKKDSSLKPTHHIRLGGEYVFMIKKMTLTPRLGLFYDPEPAEGKPDDFYGFSLGLGVTLGPLAPLAIDWAYQYRCGKNVEGDSLKGENSPAEVRQHLFYNSVIYYF